MKIITGLSEQPKQQSTLVLADGTRAVWTLAFVPQQSGWFFDLTWNGTAIASGQRLVSSPNILRQYLNRISFGIAVVSPNQLDPTTQTAFVDGSILCYLLEGADLQTVETNLFAAPPGQVLPEVALPGGAVAPVLPSSWGPAGGDLAYLYPNPQVVAVHEGGGTRLPFAAVGDGQFLKRVGGAIIGAAVAPGTGDVVGPGASTVNNVALFDNTTGTLLKDGGALGTAAFVNSTSFLAATAAASGDLGGNFPSPTVTALHTGVTQLTIGSIPDGQFLKRVGNDIVGSIPSGAGDVFGPASSTNNNVALFDGTTGKLLKDSGLALGTIASQAASAVSISGGSLSGVSITSSTGAFTALSSTSTFTAASFINSDFIGGAAFRALSATTNAKWIQITNTGGDAIFGQENSVGGLAASLITGASAYDTIIRGPSGISFSANAGGLQMRLSTAGLEVTGALSATGAVNFGTTSTSGRFTLGQVTSTVVDDGIILRTGSTKTAWLLGAQYNVDNGFEITPSTAAGGTTFSSPVFRVASTGVSVTGALSATGASTLPQIKIGGVGQQGWIGNTGTSYPALSANLEPDGLAGWKYLDTDSAALMAFGAASISFRTAPSGTAGTTATLTERVLISTTGLAVTGALSASGVITAPAGIDTSGVTCTNGLSFSAGRIYGNATDGLVVGAKTGSGHDLSFFNPAGTTAIMRVPTGTLNANFGGNVSAIGTVSATSFSGSVPVASLNSGIGASNTTFWRGDGVWATPAGGGGGISSISVASSNGFAGNSSGGTTPTLTLSTTVTGLLKGNGTALSAATAGTDYVIPSGSVNNVTGIVAIANGGTGTSSPSLVAGTNVTITGTWPNQTINATGGGGGGGGTVISVSGTGTVNGISLSGTVTTTGSLTLSGALSGDISATTSKSAATGAVLRSFTSRDGDVVNVKDFGASTANTEGQNTIAFGLAIAAAIAFPKGAIYVPTGTYKLNKLSISSAVPLTIYGDGEGSILQAYDTNGLIDFSSAANYATLEIRNLRMEALSASNAITATFLPVASYHIVNSFKLTSVTVAGGGSTWARAVKVSYAHNALISNCLFDGGSGTYSSGNRAFEVLATSVNMIFANTNFSFWGRGYSCEVYAEGASFTNCYFISNSICAYASVASSDLRITGLQFISCNFDARDTGSYVLYCNNVQGLLVSSCYILGGAGTSGGLRLIQTQFSSITGNKFFSTGQYGVTLENASPAVYDDLGNQIGCNAVSITGNNFVGDAFSVLVGTLTMNTVVQNNVRARAYSVGSPVTFQGAQMTVVNLNTSDASGGVTRGNYIQP